MDQSFISIGDTRSNTSNTNSIYDCDDEIRLKIDPNCCMTHL